MWPGHPESPKAWPPLPWYEGDAPAFTVHEQSWFTRHLTERATTFIESCAMEGSPFFPEPPAFCLESFPLLRGRLADRLTHHAGLLVEPVDVGLELPPEQVKFGKPADIGLGAPLTTVFGDEVDVVGNKAAIEHGQLQGGGKRCF